MTTLGVSAHHSWQRRICLSQSLLASLGHVPHTGHHQEQIVQAAQDCSCPSRLLGAPSHLIQGWRAPQATCPMCHMGSVWPSDLILEMSTLPQCSDQNHSPTHPTTWQKVYCRYPCLPGPRFPSRLSYLLLPVLSDTHCFLAISGVLVELH